MDEDQWWASLSPARKKSIRRWLDPDDPEHLRAEAAKHPDQLPLPLLDLDVVSAEADRRLGP